MTCKDCFLYQCEICDGYIPTDFDKDIWHYCAQGKQDEIPDIEERCSSFKLKSRIVELPCAVGDKFWLLNLNEEQNRILEIDPICEAVVDRIEILRDNVERFILRLPTKHLRLKIRCVENFGKTVFLTKEEAEKALAEWRANNG